MTHDRAIEIALLHHRAGRLGEAEGIYRQILSEHPGHSDALHLLGVVAHQLGQCDVAVDLIGKAIAITPHDAAFHCNLGEALRHLNRLDEAAAAFSRAIKLNPDLAEAHCNLGHTLWIQGKLVEAETASAKAIELNPKAANAFNNLGNALWSQGKIDEAIAAYSKAIAIAPDYAGAYSNLGNALREKGDLETAMTVCMRAIHLEPNNAEAHNNLGSTLMKMGRLEEAAAACSRAIKLRPADDQAHNNLGTILFIQCKQEEAVAAYTRAIELQPHNAEAYSNLAGALRAQYRLDESLAACAKAIELKPNQVKALTHLAQGLRDGGQIEGAMEAYSRAMAVNPKDADIHSRFLLTLHLDPDYDAHALFAAHRQWNERHAQPLKQFICPWRNDRDPNRRLKVGYVSGNLNTHPVGRFMMTLLQDHDPGEVEVFCYADIWRGDELTDRIRNHAHAWRDTIALTDEQLAQCIHDDGIDILVDLMMHADGNRLLVFARKPAPVQVTYLAYCSTTGLDAMDYRLTDAYIDPPTAGGSYYSERSVYLPETYWCYEPPIDKPEISFAPPSASGVVTFGCLNNFAKASSSALSIWARLLERTPNSRLLLHASPGSHRQRAIDALIQNNIDPARLRFAAFLPHETYFRLYGEIDVALDPFPFGGGTTTCDAIWMGVPVVTLAGRTAVGRGGVSILNTVGMPELIATTPRQYMDIAASLAGDLPRLTALRTGLRDRMRRSPLMDAPRFARNMESAYRKMWRTWCAAGE